VNKNLFEFMDRFLTFQWCLLWSCNWGSYLNSHCCVLSCCTFNILFWVHIIMRAIIVYSQVWMFHLSWTVLQ